MLTFFPLPLYKLIQANTFIYPLIQRKRDMGSIAATSDDQEKPHAVCIPYPAQGHINPMLKLAKILHSYGFHITFVLTEYNHSRLLRSHGPAAAEGLADFRFEAIPDGLPHSEDDATQDIPALSDAVIKNFLAPFRRLLAGLNRRHPPVSCIVSDAVTTFTLDAARELGVPEVLFWTASACGYLAYHHYQHLVDRGLAPLKDMSDVSNGYLDTKVDWIPGLLSTMTLKDFPSFLRTVNSDDIMFNFLIRETSRATAADAIIINTFEELESAALAALRNILPPIYTIGPLSVLSHRAVPGDTPLAAVTTSLWKPDRTCLDWLHNKEPHSVVYVNFGSITVMSRDQLVEFAYGLANSGYHFVWIVRPDLVKGEAAALPPEFVEETRSRGLLATWCEQEEVLSDPAVGVFLTHAGWNSVLESFSGGVPMICWPFFAEQQTNCKYICEDWRVGMEIDSNVKRDEVERLIREMMAGEQGREMRKKAEEWKKKAEKASEMNGRSEVNLDRMVREVLLKES